MFLRNDKQKTFTDSSPNLCVHGIFDGSVKSLYMQMLLYSFEEQLNLPSFPIQLGNDQYLKLEVIGEETINCICAEVSIHDKSKRIRILLGSKWPNQFDGFIREKSSRLIYLSTFNNLVKHIFFCSCYKIGIVKMKMLIQRGKLDISYVHKIVRDSFYQYLIYNSGIVNRSFCQMDKCRDGALKIHQGMHLDYSSLMMKLSLWTKRQTQLNSAAVKGTDHFIHVKSKFLSLICFLYLSYQNLCKVLIDSSILLFARFSKGVFGHGLNTGTIKVRRTKVKCSIYVTQPGPVPKLNKVHYHELVTASEFDCVPVTLISIDALLNFVYVYKKHSLCKYCFSFVHRLQDWLFIPSCKTMISNRKILFSL